MRTAESVSPMHPDKICDRISDAILDECLKQDPMSRVAIETMGGHGIITITGELTTSAYVDMRAIAQAVAGPQYGVQVNVVKQSHEIAQGVDAGGAGDQGIMVGYATRETPSRIPREVFLARELNRAIYSVYPFDGKTQVTLNDDGTIHAIVVSWQNVEHQELMNLTRAFVRVNVGVENGYHIYANPAGDWSQGGFEADTGLTGRKLAVDNYGPRIPIGGGCFSGKDPSKVDRSAAYMARKLAVDYLETDGNADEVFVRLAYAIGVAEPVEATVELVYHDENGHDRYVTKQVDQKIYDLTPLGIIDLLDLRKAQYEATAEYGHFGNHFTWDKVEL